MTETRVRNEATGGEKGAKDEKFSLIPWDVMREVARHYAFGASKYAPWNWRKGYDWSLSADALQRHFVAFWMDHEDDDEETGTPHLAAVIFHAAALLFFSRHFPQLDDRPPLPPAPVVKEGEALTFSFPEISFEIPEPQQFPAELFGVFDAVTQTEELAQPFRRTGEDRDVKPGEWFVRIAEPAGLAQQAGGGYPVGPREILEPV